MKYFKILFFVVLLFPSTCCEAQEVKITGISHSDFVEEIMPNMSKPAVILFGSNYCKYSRSQLKLLRTFLEKKENQHYLKYMDFYSVNVDTEEDSDWFDSIYDADDDYRGTPTWVFYFPTKDGGTNYYYTVGNFTETTLRGHLHDLYIDFYYY